ncbi:type-1 angiotensin II receptor-associated protein isoform X1 [Tympanuchus pallidicinctus]|uniref:type-1 angiotensin II receptor-associated protein isoform X1 n=1 Tax=Tympanuchus pallidicinctus TaxID=109042 RepID=UPI0022872E36|nr:type-1 angiotensin II receptor-associated protein isoform X1 [Tympanuchus pallidicinctus]
MELPAVSLKAIILVHWLLTVWGCMNNSFPASYAWGNFSVLAVGIWAIVQRDSLDAIVMFLTGLLLTVLTDIIHISVYYPLRGYPSDVKRFSMGMAIFSLLLKPGSCYFVYRMYRERGGDYIFNIDLESSSDSQFAYNGTDVTAVTLTQLTQVSTVQAGTAVPMRQSISRKALRCGLTQARQLSIHIEALVCSRTDTSLPQSSLTLLPRLF